MPETVLTITGFGLTPYSARGIQQTLEPIPQASNMRRTVNGALVDVSAPEFRKYRSVISCDDMNVPAIDRVWPGQQVTVDCVTELSYATSGGSAGKTVVSGSSRTEGSFTFYRPRLTMRIVNFNQTIDETGAVLGWELELEEV
jgi:hypothetical protein